jgi:O-6-methylguanine DNA methyltransferase
MEPEHTSETLYLSSIDSPLGPITLITTARGLLYVCFPGREKSMKTWLKRFAPRAEISLLRKSNLRAEKQLKAYFQGKSRAFDLPLDLRGTPFQIAAWKAIAQIPYGATATYGEIAKAIRRPGAARAVGGAANKNPTPVVVPCHRVIGSDGSLVGFGGGLRLKRLLLKMEGSTCSPGNP